MSNEFNIPTAEETREEMVTQNRQSLYEDVDRCINGAITFGQCHTYVYVTASDELLKEVADFLTEQGYLCQIDWSFYAPNKLLKISWEELQ
ncbi:hypothetical protein vBCtySFA67_00027 [Clostridium phage vB_CtyS-FA67]|nr:hypothetical protein vBCtySFA67_00027 [Clostridium phage vB_CtyS-FA67]